MLSNEPKQALSGAVIVLVTFVMLFAAFAVMVSSTPGTSVTLGVVLTSAGVREQSGPAATCGQVPVPLASAKSYAVVASSTVTSGVLLTDAILSHGTEFRR